MRFHIGGSATINGRKFAADKPSDAVFCMIGGLCTVDGNGFVTDDAANPKSDACVFLVFRVGDYTFRIITDLDEWCPIEIVEHRDYEKKNRKRWVLCNTRALGWERPFQYSNHWGDREPPRSRVPAKNWVLEAVKQLKIDIGV